MNITKTTIITVLAVAVANFASVEGELQRNGRVRGLEKTGAVRKMRTLKASAKTDAKRSSKKSSNKSSNKSSKSSKNSSDSGSYSIGSGSYSIGSGFFGR
jgi:hypothetical protein